MTKAKPDRRTERTRMALMTAFVDLVLTEGYDAVTVERIAKRANVGRSTFYMHYTGKEEILRRSMAHPSSHLANIVGGATSLESLTPIIGHFHDQRKRNAAFFVAPIRSLWVRCLSEMIEPRLASMLRQSRTRPVVPLPLAATGIAEAQIALIAAWLTGRIAAKPEAIAEAVLLSTHVLAGALLRAPAKAMSTRGERRASVTDL